MLRLPASHRRTHRVAVRRSPRITSGAAASAPNGGMRALRERVADLESALDRAHAEQSRQAGFLQTLSRRLLEVQERERRRLAQDLHDELGQLLTRVRFALTPNASTALNSDRLELARSLVAEALERVRVLSFDLRPALLDHLGLAPALRWLLHRFTTSTQINVDFDCTGLNARFHAETETAAYRIIQESLTNVARHAGVEMVVVRVWTDAQDLYLQIEDEGAGFLVDAALAGGVTVGLPGMVERVELLGGALSLDSAPGEGTRILAILPAVGAHERRIDEHFRRLGG